jgi:putative ABC transport system permease protein
MKLFPLILKNVFRKKTRTLLTVASIVLPLLVICLMGTFLRALDRPDPGRTRGMFRLVVRHKVSLTNFLPLAYEEKIRQVPGVTAVTDFTWFGGMYVDKSAKNIFARFAVDQESFLQVFDDAQIVEGSKESWLADRTGCLVGRNIAEKFGWKLGDKIVLVGDIFPMKAELTIRAIYFLPDGTSATCFFSRKYLEEAVPFLKGNTGTFWIKAKDAEAADRVPGTVDAMFENSSAPTKTETEKQFQQFFVQMMGNVKLLLGAIATVIVAVIVLIAANTMAMTARERVTEIAVLRTLGFQRRTILSLILGESLVIALFGGLLGIGLFVLIEPGMKRNLSLGPMATLAASLQIYPSILALGFAIAVGVGLVAGIVPAIRSSQRSIVEGLRAT